MSAAEERNVESERTLTADGEVSGPHAVCGSGLPPGTMVGRYRTSRAIGVGAQGVVYAAEHLTLGYRVAVKVMHPDCDQARRARFRREARLGATLRHRHIVSVLEAGELPDGAPYLVMEHVDGCALADLIDHRRLEPAAAVELGVQMLAALAALSERGILHRDVKPDNIMLERAVDGHVSAKLLDFGISKATGADLASRTLTQDGTVLGTPYYMAPEQVRGRDLDVRTDLYAVAGVLYEALSGRPPHDGPTTAAIFADIATEPVTPLREVQPDCPEEIADIIDRALRTDPDERWSHPLEMSEALRAAAQELGLPRDADAWADVIEDTEGWLGTSAIALRSVTPARRVPSEPPPKRARTRRRGGWMAGRPKLGGHARWVAVAAVAALALTGAGFVSATDASAVRKTAVREDAGGAAKLGLVFDAPPRIGAPDSLDDPSDATLVDEAPSADDEDAYRAEQHPAARRARPTPYAGTSLDELERSARGLFVRGETGAALEMYQAVIQRSPRRASAWRGLGLVAAASGRERDARRALTRYLALAPDASDRGRIERELVRLR